MYHRLTNPNQLRHYGIKVQENSISESALSIITDENEFCTEIAMTGTIVYAETFTPSEQELHQCPHIILPLPHACDPHDEVITKNLRREDGHIERRERHG